MLGDPKKAIKSMLLPLVISYLVVQINLLVDSVWCSGLGLDPSSAVSCMAPLYWIISDVGIGLGIGASVIIARNIGRRDLKKANELCTQIVAFSVIVGIFMTIILLLILKPGIYLIRAEYVEQECIDYMLPIIFGSLFYTLSGVFAGLLRSEGAARRVMVLLFSISVINMILDPILIYTFNFGVMGAGLATTIATICSVFLAIYWYWTKQPNLSISFKNYRFNKSDIKDMLYVGIPKISESMIVNVMSFIQRIFVIMCAGTAGVAIFNMPWRYVSMGVVPALAIGAALIPICSAALGQNNFQKAKIGYYYSVKIVLKILIPLCILVFIFADVLAAPFMTSESMMAIRPEFVETLRIYALIIPLYGLIEIGSSILQSLRLAQFAMIMSFIRNFIICIAFIFAYHYTMREISIGLLFSEIIGAALMIGIAYYAIRLREKQFNSGKITSL